MLLMRVFDGNRIFIFSLAVQRNSCPVITTGYIEIKAIHENNWRIYHSKNALPLLFFHWIHSTAMICEFLYVLKT